MFDSYLLFFFAALGSFNGLALTLYLLWRKPVTPALRWLAALVFVLSVRTGKSVVFYFWPEVPKLYLQIGLTACALIGVCLLGFVRAWADPKASGTRKDPLVVLGVLALAITFDVVYPYDAYLNLWRDGPVIKFIYTSWLLCIVLAAGLVFRTIRQGKAHASAAVSTGMLTNTQVVSVVTGVALVWLAYYTSGFTSYIVGALSFSFLLYLSAMIAVAQRTWASAGSVATLPEPPEPYQDRKIDPSEARAELQSLHKLMQVERLYTNAGLTLNKVARRLNMPAARLSQLLNDNHKTPFKQYLTLLRIDAAKSLMSKPDPMSMEQIAEAVGFLSMSTFYSSFKKLEGTTPAAWRQTLVDSDS